MLPMLPVLVLCTKHPLGVRTITGLRLHMESYGKTRSRLVPLMRRDGSLQKFRNIKESTSRSVSFRHFPLQAGRSMMNKINRKRTTRSSKSSRRKEGLSSEGTSPTRILFAGDPEHPSYTVRSRSGLCESRPSRTNSWPTMLKLDGEP